MQIELVVCVSELFVGSINQSLGAKRHGPTVGGGVHFCRCEMIKFNELAGMGWARLRRSGVAVSASQIAN